MVLKRKLKWLKEDLRIWNKQEYVDIDTMVASLVPKLLLGKQNLMICGDFSNLSMLVYSNGRNLSGFRRVMRILSTSIDV